MNDINNAETVKNQYATSDRLDVRISLHSKYSANRQGFGNWIASHYDIERGTSLLELGCGTGEMWAGRQDMIDLCSRFVLTDLSEGMLEKAKRVLRDCSGIEYRTADILDIPFEDGSFDIVIANMMLYHVPDPDKGLREAKRVLKDNGTFYCATFGKNGIANYIRRMFREYYAGQAAEYSFTLENGREKLEKYFPEVRMYRYEDSLAVTDINDMADYIYSLPDMPELRVLPRGAVCRVLEKNMKDGVLYVPKSYGIFAAKRSS